MICVCDGVTFVCCWGPGKLKRSGHGVAVWVIGKWDGFIRDEFVMGRNYW